MKFLLPSALSFIIISGTLTGCGSEKTEEERPIDIMALADSVNLEDPEVRNQLPLYRTIPAAQTEDLTPANGWPADANYLSWNRSHGGHDNTRYSALNQINKQNVGDLEVAWIYRSGDLRTKTGRNLQANPVIVDGVMYAPTIGHALVAVNAATGEEIWRYLPDEDWKGYEGEYTAQRGLIYWEGEGEQKDRVYFTSGQHLYALEAASGEPITSFGDSGRTRVGVIAVAPAIFENVIVLPSKSETAVFGYDIHSGKQLWRFNTVPQPGEPNYDPRGEPYWSVFCWGGMALDESRGIAYFTMSDTNLDGGNGPMGFLSENLYANSVVAIDARTGAYIWHFQELPHDLWDLDIAAPPMLVTIERDGKAVDAVAAFTKIGNTLVLDRVTGKTLFPFRMRRAPTSPLPGIYTYPYQPDLEIPEPFAKQTFNLDDVTDRSPEARDTVMKQLENAHFGWFEPYQEPGQKLVYYAVHGGAEWCGATYDPKSDIAYVASNEFPWYWGVEDYREDEGRKFQAGRKLYEQHCALCHGPERAGIGNATSLVGIGRKYTDQNRVSEIIQQGINTMPPVVALQGKEAEVSELLQYLYAEGEAPAMDEPKYVFGPLGRLRDHEGLPGTKPPWGRLNAINLRTGKIEWRVTLGEHPDAPEELQPTGSENFGGPTVTAGGVIFCAGVKDHMIRAFDQDTGEVLWEYEMEYGGYAPPAVYEVEGKQYVVIAASSGGNPGGDLGDTYYAFSLP